MAVRKIPLITEQFYHVFNRGTNRQTIFLRKRDYRRFFDLLEFYSYKNELRYSKYLSLPLRERDEFRQTMLNNDKYVDIVAFCLMPNHFHLLIKQKADGGISKFMANLQNSYTKYFNTRHGRTGIIFQGQFRAVRVEDDDQLLHLSRYIHLNPYSSFIVKRVEDLLNYNWSSFPEYLERAEKNICEKEMIFTNFKSALDYQKFVFDGADYQRTLDQIKHLALEK